MLLAISSIIPDKNGGLDNLACQFFYVLLLFYNSLDCPYIQKMADTKITSF